ncbi:MAG: pilus assembly protein PilM [Oscillospiraceae bacterium]|nr:pilus assembly protein PilM [Oscillospiraceae bacterium]
MKAENLKPQANVVFALDIGTRTVVGVVGEQVEDAAGTGVFNMIDYVVEAHPKRAMIDGQIEDIRQVARIVSRVKEQLEERTSIKLERVSIAAAGRALKTKRLEVEFDVSDDTNAGITADKIRSMEIETIQNAAQELAAERGVTTPYYCVGYSVIGNSLDGYKMLSLEAHRGEKASVELIATFLPNVVVEGLYSVMDMCSLSVASLTLEPIAAMNAIIPREIRLINIALVDIGAGTSDIAVSKDGSIVAYAMATIAGDEITEEIIKTYFVDFDTAEAIKQSCCGGEDYTYRDIFGVERVITHEDFIAKIEASVDGLAETICDNILQANGGSSPAAVFLIGGGSLIKGLPQAVSGRLDIPIERVALGSNESLKSINTGGNVMGAEFVTPLGIAVTGVMNKGYDFSVITLNDKSIRIFNTNKITVFELLSMAGYKSAQILGRSGHSLAYFINGERKTIRGGGFEPAQVRLGDKQVSLSDKITGGDRIEFVPSVCGENAKITLKEALFPGSEAKADFSVPDDLGVTVNGVAIKAGEWDYLIQNLDKIETFIVVSDLDDDIGDGGEADGAKPFVSDVPDISVILNGEIVTLMKNEGDMPHTFLELLNYSDMDFENPKGEYVMLINNAPAGFSNELKDGDEAVLKWKEA